MRNPSLLIITFCAAAVQARAASPDDLRERILRQVNERIEARRARILERVQQILAEELPRVDVGAPAPQSALATEIQRQRQSVEEELTRLQDQWRDLEAQIYQRQVSLIVLRWMERDAAMLEELRANPQQWARRYQELWQDAFADIAQRGNYLEGAEKFRRLFYMTQGNPSQADTNAYNAACGFSLAGEVDPALDWLEISLAAGIWRQTCPPSCTYCGGGPFLRHIEMDTDLDNIRRTERFREIIRRYERQ
jgi:hypothetical protein